MNELFHTFFIWNMLGTLAGASAATGLITAFLDMSLNRRGQVPTQIISCCAAFIILLFSLIFTGNFSVNTGVLCIFNALSVSSATSGTISAARRLIRRKEGQ